MFRPAFEVGDTLAKTGADKSSREIWRNVSEHCLAEAVLTDVLAEELKLPNDERHTIVSAAILHDWYKKHEQVGMRVAKQAGTYSLATLDVLTAESHTILRDQFHIPEEVIELSSSNVSPTADGPQSLDAKVLWYVDAILTGTDVVRIPDRFDDLERGWTGKEVSEARATANLAFSDAYKEQYAGRSLYEVQRQLGQSIGRELADRVGYTGNPDDLPLYLKEKIEARIAGA